MNYDPPNQKVIQIVKSVKKCVISYSAGLHARQQFQHVSTHPKISHDQSVGRFIAGLNIQQSAQEPLSSLEGTCFISLIIFYPFVVGCIPYSHFEHPHSSWGYPLIVFFMEIIHQFGHLGHASSAMTIAVTASWRHPWLTEASLHGEPTGAAPRALDEEVQLSKRKAAKTAKTMKTSMGHSCYILITVLLVSLHRHTHIHRQTYTYI